MKYLVHVIAGVLIIFAYVLSGSTLLNSEEKINSKELDKQIDSLADQISKNLTTQKTAKIAVIDFSNLNGKATEFGKYIAEELTTRLFRSGKFQIIERRLITKIMDEQKISATGLIDEKSASKFGKILGVDAIATGTVTDLNTSVRVNSRLIATESGSVFAAASVNIQIDDEVSVLLGRKPVNATPNKSPKRFDGSWEVNLNCPPYQSAKGYIYKFNADVKDGILHAQYGTDGIAPCLTLDGKINVDGSSVLNVRGLTGDPKFIIGSAKKGSQYKYHVDANFTEYKGTGKRIETRPTEFLFIKK
jgi:TolB-like protein